MLSCAGSASRLSLQYLSLSQRPGTQPRQLTQNDQRDILYHMSLCSTIKAGGEGGEGGTHYETVFPRKQLLHLLRPCFSRCGWTSLGVQKWRIIIFFFTVSRWSLLFRCIKWLLSKFAFFAFISFHLSFSHFCLVKEGIGRAALWV